MSYIVMGWICKNRIYLIDYIPWPLLWQNIYVLDLEEMQVNKYLYHTSTICYSVILIVRTSMLLFQVHPVKWYVQLF
jgi:hypothetical protein